MDIWVSLINNKDNLKLIYCTSSRRQNQGTGRRAGTGKNGVVILVK
jgi:hypothetical protein